MLCILIDHFVLLLALRVVSTHSYLPGDVFLIHFLPAISFAYDLSSRKLYIVNV